MRSTSNKILKLHEIDRRALTIPSSQQTVVQETDNFQPMSAIVEEVLADARQQAAMIVESSRKEAQRIVSEAEKTAAEIVSKARTDGYTEGYETGLAAANQQMRQHIETLAEIVANASLDKMAIIREAEAEIISLVIDVARKVIRREITIDRSVVVRLVEGALQKVGGQVALRIRVNPDDFDLVNAYWKEREGSYDQTGHVEVIADKRVKHGGCVIDTQGGTIDAQIDAQLAEIRKAFESVSEP